MKKIRVGIIGCGKISDIYLQNGSLYEGMEITACADLDLNRAQAKADKFGVPHAYSVDELLADPTIDIVLNLTIPRAHAAVAMQALHAGKHVYGEKPLAVTREEADQMIELARDKGLLIGCAPDTFLGGGHQTCRKLIDDGLIGRPVAALALMMGKGPESWHPDPEFYYDIGGGPMFDMGPYYLTALINMLGPIRRVTGSAQIGVSERTITSQPKYGQKIEVKVPTHIAGVLDFECGVVATMITSFEIFGGKSDLPNIEIYGTEGTLRIPDPNIFGGRVLLKRMGSEEWTEVPLTHEFQGNSRGVGLLDMINALRNGRAHRANEQLSYHVLEAMHGIHEASRDGQHYVMSSRCERPAALPAGLQPNTTD